MMAIRKAAFCAVLICSLFTTVIVGTTDDEQNPLKLKMIIELTRHGERAPKEIFTNLTIGKNFEVKAKDLTSTGA